MASRSPSSDPQGETVAVPDLLRSRYPGRPMDLLVVRDLALGKRRFAEFETSPEAIPTNILADRLKRLVAAGIVSASRYSEHPPRVEYALTTKERTCGR